VVNSENLIFIELRQQGLREKERRKTAKVNRDALDRERRAEQGKREE
jgi:hypothetical protein